MLNGTVQLTAAQFASLLFNKIIASFGFCRFLITKLAFYCNYFPFYFPIFHFTGAVVWFWILLSGYQQHFHMGQSTGLWLFSSSLAKQAKRKGNAAKFWEIRFYPPLTHYVTLHPLSSLIDFSGRSCYCRMWIRCQIFTLNISLYKGSHAAKENTPWAAAGYQICSYNKSWEAFCFFVTVPSYWKCLINRTSSVWIKWKMLIYSLSLLILTAPQVIQRSLEVPR